MKHKHMQAFTGIEPICEVCGELFADENAECPGKPTPTPVVPTTTITQEEYEALCALRNTAQQIADDAGQSMDYATIGNILRTALVGINRAKKI